MLSTNYVLSLKSSCYKRHLTNNPLSNNLLYFRAIKKSKKKKKKKSIIFSPVLWDYLPELCKGSWASACCQHFSPIPPSQCVNTGSHCPSSLQVIPNPHTANPHLPFGTLSTCHISVSTEQSHSNTAYYVLSSLACSKITYSNSFHYKTMKRRYTLKSDSFGLKI